MNKETLITKLNFFLDPNNDIGAVLYFVLHKEGETFIRFADIEREAKNELKEQFLEYIREKFIQDEEFVYENISEADERKNVIYKYDVDDRPESLSILDEILKNEEQIHFNFKEDKLRDVQGYLVTIGNEGNKIALYKKHHAVNILRKERFWLISNGERLEKVKNDAIALDKNFDFMMIDSSLIILKLNTLEKFFGFEDVIRKQASNTIALIKHNDILVDVEQLHNIAQSMPNARKLMNIRTSPVFSITSTNIISFIKNIQN